MGSQSSSSSGHALGPETQFTNATSMLSAAAVWDTLTSDNVQTAVMTAEAAKDLSDKAEVALLLSPAAHLVRKAHGTSDLEAARKHSELYWATVTIGTRQTYGGHIISFLAWCDEVGLPMHLRFPIGENILVLYLQRDMAAIRAGTVTSRRCALQYWHRVQRMPWPLERADNKAILRASKIVCLPPLEKRRPVRLNDLAAMAAKCDRTRAAEIAVLAAAFFAFWALCRPGEVTVRNASKPRPDRAHWSNLVLQPPRTPSGVASFLPRLPSDKTHGSAGFDRIASEQRHIPSLCAVAAIRQHLITNALVPGEDPGSTGAFSYRTVEGPRRELTENFFESTVNKWLHASRRSRITGHCFRIGAATILFAANKPLHDIQLRGGWESEAYLVYLRDNYVRHAEMFGDIDPAGLFYD